MTSTITLKRESHKDPQNFRIKYEDASLILDVKNDTVNNIVNPNLPVKTSTSKVAIVGGGFAGISASLTCIKKLKEEDFVLFEKHADLGGTWWANTYPGCASDIPALWYSIHDELVDNWSDLRPPQPEMEEYIQNIIAKYRLKEKTQTKIIVDQAKYNDDAGTWTIYARNLRTGQKLEHTSKILISGTGGLVVPNTFSPPGMENFKGAYMHSGIWDWNQSFEDKKVVVVGNGCSAAQVVPALLKYKPKKITQLVRSQHYIFPPHPPFLQKLYWLLSFTGALGLTFIRLFVATIAEMRYPMFYGTSWLSELMRSLNTKMSLKYMKSTIPEKYHDILIPKFKIGCKRLIFDYFYAPSLSDERIDVKLDEIKEVKEHSVVLTNGEELEADILVACTGYNLNKSFAPYKIIGRNGFDISKVWLENGASAYETILLKNCPNYFTLAGPNSATGHSSVVLAIENGCKYFSLVGKKVLDGTYKSICVKDQKYDDWYTNTQNLLKKSVFGTPFGGCISWYTTAKANSTVYPYSQVTYWWRMRHPKWNDFELEKVKAD